MLQADIMFLHIFQYIKSHNGGALIILAAPRNKITVLHHRDIGFIVPALPFVHHIQMSPYTDTFFLFRGIVGNLPYIIIIVLGRKTIFFTHMQHLFQDLQAALSVRRIWNRFCFRHASDTANACQVFYDVRHLVFNPLLNFRQTGLIFIQEFVHISFSPPSKIVHSLLFCL